MAGPGDNTLFQAVDNFQTRIDYASSTINYIGEASPNAATSSAVWRIKRITKDSSGRTTAIDWADGNTNFDNVWDDRASLSYGV